MVYICPIPLHIILIINRNPTTKTKYDTLILHSHLVFDKSNSQSSICQIFSVLATFLSWHLYAKLSLLCQSTQIEDGVHCPSPTQVTLPPFTLAFSGA